MELCVYLRWVYGFVEKIVLGNIAAVIVGLLCPMHIMWQMNQGGHYFEHEKAKAAGDERTAKKEWRLAVLLPFFSMVCGTVVWISEHIA